MLSRHVRAAPSRWRPRPRPRQTPPYICADCTAVVSRRQAQKCFTSGKRSESESAGEETGDADAAAVTAQEPGRKQSLLSILEGRGFIKDIAGNRDTLDRLLTEKRVAAYSGIDPTAQSMHMGHLLPTMVLLWLYIHGHRAVSLLGGATASIGDPTGRLTSRADVDTETRRTNVVCMTVQLKALWRNLDLYAAHHGFKKEAGWRKDIVNNNTWLNGLGIVQFLKTLGTGARMGTMLGRDTVKNKMDKGDGMSFAEFTYPLLQAWDWWHMYNCMGVQLQIGGSDQMGNIVAGGDAIKHIASKATPDMIHRSNPLLKADTVEKTELAPISASTAPYGVTTPLLTTASGAKFGKSAGNAVWLDKTMTSSYDLYGFLLRTSDADVERHLKLFTLLPLPAIAEAMASHAVDATKRIPQHLLAREVIHLVHGAADAENAAQQHKLLRAPTLSSVLTSDKSTTNSPTTASSSENPVHRTVLPMGLVRNVAPARVLYHAGLTGTVSEATRLINAGGVYLAAPSANLKPDADSQLIFQPLGVSRTIMGDCAQKDGVLVLRKGKWRVTVVDVVEDDVFEERGLTCPGWDALLKTRTETEQIKDLFLSKANKEDDGKWKTENDMWTKLREKRGGEEGKDAPKEKK